MTSLYVSHVQLYETLFTLVYVTSLPWSGDRYNIGYPSETHLKPKSHEVSFVQNIHLSCQAVLEMCAEHGSNITVFSAKLPTICHLLANEISRDFSSALDAVEDKRTMCAVETLVSLRYCGKFR